MDSENKPVNFLTEKEVSLFNTISDKLKTGKISETALETDDKVLARITDGIYRRPSSALRELISNAYDADAGNVIIDTDVPRFESMTIRDDGNGMSIEILVNLLAHIGGSAKRNNIGKNLKVTDPKNSKLSLNKKRKLIGKIGIGLFSVAQLTRYFEIVTKEKDKDYYLKARVKLYNYSDEYIAEKDNPTSNDERGKSFKTGNVEIWTEKTDNVSAHGTDIILHDIKKSAIGILKSSDIWGQESALPETDPQFTGSDFLNSSKLESPIFHVGSLSGTDGHEYFEEKKQNIPSLPWNEEDNEDTKFLKLYDGVLALTKNTVNPKLGSALDNYFEMIWTLALSIPLNYIYGHPFSLSSDEMPDCYIISNKAKGQVTEAKSTNKKTTFSDYASITTDTTDVGFNVIIDKIKLFRPIKFVDLPSSKTVIKKPILFIGSYTPDLSSMNHQDSAGELSFDAYALWSPKVIPKEHNGVLIRLHNASGIMFDETFMKHQVAEHTIKSQLMIEIFVNKGLDSALNIDRESFNISHPHYQIVMKWLHQAIRQIVNKYKLLRDERLSERRDDEKLVLIKTITDSVDESLRKRGRDPSEKPNLNIYNAAKRESKSSAENNSIAALDTFEISLEDYTSTTKKNRDKTSRSILIEARLEAILQLLDGYGLFENISASEQKSLIEDILRILSIEG